MSNDDKPGNSKATEINGKLATQIRRYLSEGKNKLISIERQITGGEKYAKIAAGVNRTREKLRKVKHQAENYGSKAEQYIKRNPKKSIVLAAAAGALAGGLWAAFSGKKSTHKKKVGPPKVKPAPSKR
jgi:hypothetical protein